MDDTKLALARDAAKTRGIANVEFRAANVNGWREADVYDVVFRRFLLQHLSRPVDLLRRMWASVRPGGAIIVEDADFDGWFCHPPNAGFEFFLETYTKVIAGRAETTRSGASCAPTFSKPGSPTRT